MQCTTATTDVPRQALGRLAILRKQFIDFVAGPTNLMWISKDNSSFYERHRNRPVQVEIDPAAVLHFRQTLPKISRRDVREVVRLKIGLETPFKASELLIHFETSVPPDHPEQIQVDASLVPRYLVEDAIAEHSCSGKRVVQVFSVQGGHPSRVDFTHSYRPLMRWKRRVWALPVLLFLALSSYVYLLEKGARDTAAQSLVGRINNASEKARVLDYQVSELEEIAKTSDAVAKAYAGYLSVQHLFHTLRYGLDKDALIKSITLREGAAFVAVEAPDILAAVRTLTHQSVGYRVDVSGPVSRNLATGLEQATLRIERKH